MNKIDDIYQEVFNMCPMLVAFTDYTTGEFLEVNEAFCKKTGYLKDEIIGKNPKKLEIFIEEEAFVLVQKELREVGVIDNKVLKIQHKSGQIYNGIFSGKICDNNGNKVIVTTMTDISMYTEKNRLAEVEQLLEEKSILLEENKKSLEVSQHRNKAIVNVLPDMLFVYSKDGYFLDCQTNDEKDMLMPKEMFINKHMSDIMPSDISEKGLACIKQTISSGRLKNFEYELLINGESKYFETRMVKSSEDEVLAIVRDITSKKHEEQLILDLSYKDALTGLYNRRYFQEYMDKINEEKYLPTCLVMIDVNGLKLTNDAFGHLVGDELLKKVAGVICEVCPSGAMISRIGGDEFVAIVTNFDHESSHQLTDAIYERIEKVSSKESIVSVSIGFETRSSISVTLRECFIRAENHMFRRKLVESQSMRHQTVMAILNTLNEKNQREKEHSEQVSKISIQIGKEMGYSSHELKEIEMIGLLHDIGKIAIREEVLNKPGKLTDEEYNEIKKHPESGYHILKTVDEYLTLAEAVLSHHERIDGKGYPRGLCGDQIPEMAKIIAVADAYDAMVSNRTYRKGIGHQAAIEELKVCSGTQFDSQVVEAFVKSFL